MEHVLYINLESRTDRRVHIEQQLNDLGVSYTRMNAIYNEKGYIGVSQSHIQCLQTAIQQNWSRVCIVEDDMCVIDIPVFQNSLTTFLSTHSTWDVLLLGGNVGPPYLREPGARRVKNAQTTTAYIVNQPYYKTLLRNFQEGLALLKIYDESLYCIDIHWKRLQQTDQWYVLDPLSVVQKPGYSDIEKRNVNYVKPMLSYKE